MLKVIDAGDIPHVGVADPLSDGHGLVRNATAAPSHSEMEILGS